MALEWSQALWSSDLKQKSDTEFVHMEERVGAALIKLPAPSQDQLTPGNSWALSWTLEVFDAIFIEIHHFLLSSQQLRTWPE